jgi:hypothetical protein
VPSRRVLHESKWEHDGAEKWGVHMVIVEHGLLLDVPSQSMSDLRQE